MLLAILYAETVISWRWKIETVSISRTGNYQNAIPMQRNNGVMDNDKAQCVPHIHDISGPFY